MVDQREGFMDHTEKSIYKSNPGEKPLSLRVGSRGRLTIPHQILTILGWNPGDTLVVILDDEGHLTVEKRS